MERILFEMPDKIVELNSACGSSNRRINMCDVENQLRHSLIMQMKRTKKLSPGECEKYQGNWNICGRHQNPGERSNSI